MSQLETWETIEPQVMMPPNEANATGDCGWCSAGAKFQGVKKTGTQKQQEGEDGGKGAELDARQRLNSPQLGVLILV